MMGFFKNMLIGWVFITLLVLYNYQKNRTPEDEARFRQWLEKHQSTSKKLRDDQKFKANPKPKVSQSSPLRPNKKEQSPALKQSCKGPACKALEEQAEAQLFKEAAEAMKEMDAQAMRTMGRRR